MRQMPSDERDDVDRVFARLQPATPPPLLAQRIMQALPAQVPMPAASPAPVVARAGMGLSRRAWQWIAGVAVAALILMSLRLGASLDDSGSLTVLSGIFQDFSTFLSAPGDYLVPLVAELPWLDLIITIAALVAFWVSASALVNRGAHGPGRGAHA